MATSLDKPALVQGEKGTLTVKVTRIAPDLKTPLTVRAIATELPKGLTLNNNQPLNIAAKATDGKLPINVQANVQPGTYTLVLHTQTQMPYNKDPKAKQKPNTIVVLPSTAGDADHPAEIAGQADACRRRTSTVKLEQGSGGHGAGAAAVRLRRRVQGAGGAAGRTPRERTIADAVIPAGKDEAKLIVKAGAKPVQPVQPDRPGHGHVQGPCRRRTK